MTSFKGNVAKNIHETVKIEGRIHHNIQTQVIEKEHNTNQYITYNIVCIDFSEMYFIGNIDQMECILK